MLVIYVIVSLFETIFPYRRQARPQVYNHGGKVHRSRSVEQFINMYAYANVIIGNILQITPSCHRAATFTVTAYAINFTQYTYAVSHECH